MPKRKKLTRKQKKPKKAKKMKSKSSRKPSRKPTRKEKPFYGDKYASDIPASQNYTNFLNQMGPQPPRLTGQRSRVYIPVSTLELNPFKAQPIPGVPAIPPVGVPVQGAPAVQHHHHHHHHKTINNHRTLNKHLHVMNPNSNPKQQTFVDPVGPEILGDNPLNLSEASTQAFDVADGIDHEDPFAGIDDVLKPDAHDDIFAGEDPYQFNTPTSDAILNPGIDQLPPIVVGDEAARFVAENAVPVGESKDDDAFMGDYVPTDFPAPPPYSEPVDSSVDEWQAMRDSAWDSKQQAIIAKHIRKTPDAQLNATLRKGINVYKAMGEPGAMDAAEFQHFQQEMGWARAKRHGSGW